MLLKTPTGGITLVAALLACGFVLREYRGRRNGAQPALPAGEHTGELLKDLDALGPGPGADVLAPDVLRLEGRLAGVESEMRAGHAGLQQQIIDLRLENQQQGTALEGKIADVDGKIAEARKNSPAETAVLVIEKLREEGGGAFDRRKKATTWPLHLERRKRGR